KCRRAPPANHQLLVAGERHALARVRVGDAQRLRRRLLGGARTEGQCRHRGGEQDEYPASEILAHAQRSWSFGMTRPAKSSSARDPPASPVPPQLICIEGSNSPNTSR